MPEPPPPPRTARDPLELMACWSTLTLHAAAVGAAGRWGSPVGCSAWHRFFSSVPAQPPPGASPGSLSSWSSVFAIPRLRKLRLKKTKCLAHSHRTWQVFTEIQSFLHEQTDSGLGKLSRHGCLSWLPCASCQAQFQKEGERERERERKRYLPSTGSLSRWRSQELHAGLGPCSAAFPGSLTGSWTRSGATWTQTGVNRLVIIDWKDPQRSFLFKDAWHHITMYGFFVFSGVVDIMSQWRRERQWVKLERAAEALAFYVLALLMANHLENKSTLEIRVHVLFMVPVLLVALVLSIEVWVPEQPQLWVLKTWMGLVLSSWLLQLSVLLYMPPSGQPWRADNPTDIAFLSIFFCWHLALGIAILAATYGLCSLWHHRFSSWTEATGAGYKLCPTDSRGEELEKLKAEAVLQDGGI